MNGKLSERSAKRFALLPLFARRLFSRFNTLCLQDELQQRRFLPLIADPSRLLITGNLKLDFAPEPVDTDQWRKKLGLKPNQPVITIALARPPILCWVAAWKCSIITSVFWPMLCGCSLRKRA